MTRANAKEMGTMDDALAYALEVGNEYGVRIRLSCVPLAKTNGKSTHALEARAYSFTGKPVLDVEREQALYPGGTSRTVAGGFLYLLTRLSGTLDEWKARSRREQEQWEQGELTALEEYIAGSFTS